MADVFSQLKRSAVMSAIKGKGNKATEIRLIEVMRDSGIKGWRRNQPIFGQPDFVFLRERVAVFVDGCFWHRHPRCKFAYTPKSRLEFWLEKFSRNVVRDRLVNQTLRKTGWRVVRIWECQLRISNRSGSRKAIRSIRAAMRL